MDVAHGEHTQDRGHRMTGWCDWFDALTLPDLLPIMILVALAVAILSRYMEAR